MAKFLTGGPQDHSSDLSGKVFAITGGDANTGRQTVLQLAKCHLDCIFLLVPPRLPHVATCELVVDFGKDLLTQPTEPKDYLSLGLSRY